MKAVRLMFHDGDPARPNSFEHYDPETGGRRCTGATTTICTPGSWI